MANFREYSARLVSMSGMRRVTATMKMVAASHLHRAQVELRLPEPFAATLLALDSLVKRASFASHRINLPPPATGGRVLLLVISANRGLCGAFNNSVVREVRRWAREQKATRGVQVDAIYLGRKGYMALWREFAPIMKALDLSVHPQAKETSAISKYAMDAFLDRKVDEVWVAGNRFVSAMTYEPRLQRLLPYQSRSQIIKKTDLPPAFEPSLVEPDDDRMLEAITRQWVHLELYYALLHSVSSEHASRVMAMENATVNLRRMEKELILLRNRARQAAITNELTEIVSGAESLG
jgi:F-type H+-transporting ATPase subunit gamma